MVSQGEYDLIKALLRVGLDKLCHPDMRPKTDDTQDFKKAWKTVMLHKLNEGSVLYFGCWAMSWLRSLEGSPLTLLELRVDSHSPIGDLLDTIKSLGFPGRLALHIEAADLGWFNNTHRETFTKFLQETQHTMSTQMVVHDVCEHGHVDAIRTLKREFQGLPVLSKVTERSGKYNWELGQLRDTVVKQTFPRLTLTTVDMAVEQFLKEKLDDPKFGVVNFLVDLSTPGVDAIAVLSAGIEAAENTGKIIGDVFFICATEQHVRTAVEQTRKLTKSTFCPIALDFSKMENVGSVLEECRISQPWEVDDYNTMASISKERLPVTEGLRPCIHLYLEGTTSGQYMAEST